MAAKKKRVTDINISPALRADFAHYEKLIGLGAALELLASRSISATKLQKKKEKSRTEKQASSKPDGRLNGPNLARGSLVQIYGGKRKLKKTKRGY